MRFELKLAVLESTGRICWYCGCDLSPGAFHVEHQIPVCQGGETVESNLVPACPSCNISKQGRTVGEFRCALVERVAKSIAASIELADKTGKFSPAMRGIARDLRLVMAQLFASPISLVFFGEGREDHGVAYNYPEDLIEEVFANDPVGLALARSRFPQVFREEAPATDAGPDGFTPDAEKAAA